jgi:hypothetical protein
MLIFVLVGGFLRMDYEDLDEDETGHINARCSGKLYLSYEVREYWFDWGWGGPKDDTVTIRINGPSDPKEIHSDLSGYEKCYRITEKGTYEVKLTVGEGYYISGHVIFAGRHTVGITTLGSIITLLTLGFGIWYLIKGVRNGNKKNHFP